METNLLGLLSSLDGLGAAGLAGSGLLLSLLGATDGRDTGNGLLAEVSTVTVLGGLGGNTLVDPVEKRSEVSIAFSFARDVASMA